MRDSLYPQVRRTTIGASMAEELPPLHQIPNCVACPIELKTVLSTECSCSGLLGDLEAAQPTIR